MRLFDIAVWLYIAAAAHHPAGALACDGSCDDDISAHDAGLTTDDDAQLKDRVCASNPLTFSPSQSNKKETFQYGILATKDLALADEGVIPEGLGDSEEARVRFGTNLKSADGLWQVRPSPGKGLGIFALAKIPLGTRIIDETPLFTVEPGRLIPGHGFAFAAIASAVDEAFAQLNATARAAYLSCPEHRAPDGADHGISREALIFRTNGFTMGTGAIGIFPRIAKLNHACRPNAGAASVGGRRIIWAGRDIEPGEEVTITYAPLVQDTDARRARLAQWGFTCDCQACVARNDDKQRIEMKRLMGLIERELGSDAFGGDVLPDAERLVSLVEEIGLVDYLDKAYKYASYAASRLGKYGAARKWARKELKMHEIVDEESVYARETREFLESLPLL
ncbi:SET domain-containing protein 5 [Colletotrichum orchidophilum]|uniref:SET domain-containing protein 5 n=1 Tax=Colletotrichum orchidophilum TaxID=1209926 RepID=A0A1G4AYM2_9PEZI|nr:SET domain-containing protein 5 [Colletotrichum orchidophilum]OHE94216.1 SET domain-containing protein 5 [Colletotrichum orchidophilum]